MTVRYVQEVFAKRRTKTIPKSNLEVWNKELRYTEILYVCKFDGKSYEDNKKKGVRLNTRTRKVECPAFIKFCISSCKKFLVITEYQPNHQSHEHSKNFFEYLRRLSLDEKNEVIKLLKLQCNHKLLQKHILDEFGKNVTLKDITNLQSILHRSENLQEATQLLKAKGAYTQIRAINNQLKAVYFPTPDMKSKFSAWPDILFIDCTYKLLKSDLSVLLIAVEDSVGATEIVGVGLLAGEDADNFEWCFNCFKNDNLSACSRINCIMTDKDMTMRAALGVVFQEIPLYLCSFHTLQTFSREITCEKRKISKQIKTKCLEYMQKMTYSKSENEYQRLYEEFINFAPLSVKSYFDKCWHPIKDQWTYSLISGLLLISY
ncbi:uncharacterized protein LOC122850853 [Aphidius gifuensis]|uniref:uncharacterized protein LOC122850853 n=1 Tax=Aphidius gifuensis TaxID=684658 RepID=UPI001CDBE223|nr:uncharacterized protein LOC122850853 [Aphidius gifuensis]